MYASVRRYEGVTDSAEAGRRVADGFVPLISDVPGFVAYYFADAGGGVMTSTSVSGSRTTTTATITVTGQSMSVIPGWHVTVTQSASVPVERLTE